MITLAFMGEPIEIELASEQLLALNLWQRIDMVVFFLFCAALATDAFAHAQSHPFKALSPLPDIFYVLMSLILLLNLLIAMISSSFNDVYEKSTLEW